MDLKYFELNLHPYPFKAWVTTDKTTFATLCEAKLDIQKPETDGLDCAGLVAASGTKKEFIVGIFSPAIGVIIHETGHLIVTIFEQIKLPINSASIPAFTYLQKSLVTQICIELYGNEKEK